MSMLDKVEVMDIMEVVSHMDTMEVDLHSPADAAQSVATSARFVMSFATC